MDEHWECKTNEPHLYNFLIDHSIFSVEQCRYSTQHRMGWAQGKVCAARLKAEVQSEVTSLFLPQAFHRKTSAIPQPKHGHMFS